MKRLKFYKQLTVTDSGPTCLRMVARYYGKHYNTDTIRGLGESVLSGTSLVGLSEMAQKMGFRTRGVKVSFQQLMKEGTMPCILHWRQGHFVVLLPSSKFFRNKLIKVADPAIGVISCSHSELAKSWLNSVNETGERVGAALLLDTTPGFYAGKEEEVQKINWHIVIKYFRGSRWQVAQVFIALLITSLFQLMFPFLTQSVVDIGINTKNLQFIELVIIAQLVLIFSRTAVDFIRNRLLMEIGTIVNLSVLSDFWIKLTSLPLSYFERYRMGDTMQRINDNRKIQGFFTGSAVSTLFSFMNFIIFGIVLLTYNAQVFLVFLAGGALYFAWVYSFLATRRKLNYQSFQVYSKENNATVQMIQGMQEIKLNNAEDLKRWHWENIQTAIFKLGYKQLNYNQFQQSGALLINQGKDTIVTFMVARLVIEGNLTFGTMLAIQYIIGQLSNPIEQFVTFIQNVQDTKISMERLNDIYDLENEEKPGEIYINSLPENKSIQLNNLSFAYSGSSDKLILNDISLVIPEGKVTAIVGPSGSGKTTILKLLMKFYEHYSGELRIGRVNLKNMNPRYWRQQCGAVLQDGYIFNDTIAGNIAVGYERPDPEKLFYSCKLANILSFVESLPKGFNTEIGYSGTGISQGQKQRLLIARAIYRDPKYLFFDESTNALDSNNEKEIVQNLSTFFQGRTVVVVAHRLSTVRNADKIVVLQDGKVAEEGTHQELIQAEGKYYELVKNQISE
ncbi:peptidase domain-containing ABC transporter [Flavitalea sp. BT771]|uniref:peptidase domain-containing ABC transporter n=1 Tax=Flavitalea sp. BT771 TaxID=3063329 RepID=UPI0026E230E1|nr:peptidase domain-containing ABC transporter [Flavitalea sp. BT771]MDO6434796.1 peptidase domain-containing ABC transporter [Flavitalea sp. BT771]MDV6223696.1 peptidase domain-containing ABC transporter [Flavitalea sp. BT771]